MGNLTLRFLVNVCFLDSDNGISQIFSISFTVTLGNLFICRIWCLALSLNVLQKV